MRDASSRAAEPRLSLTGWHVPAIMLFGLGAHSTKQALAPAEPALHSAGMSPIGYALVSVMPAVGQILTPAAWGWLHSTRPLLSLRLCTAGVFGGQLLLFIGFGLAEGGSSLVPEALPAVVMVLGLVLFSVTRAGVSIGQATMLAHALDEQWVTRGFGLKARTLITPRSPPHTAPLSPST